MTGMNETELKNALDELKSDRAKFDYVLERSSCASVESALKAVGRSKGWFYSLPKDEQARLELLANELHAAAKLRANHVLEDALVEAAQVKVSGLRSRNESIKQSAATEILDRGVGKPTQRQEVTGAEGGAVKHVLEVVYIAGKKDAGTTPQD